MLSDSRSSSSFSNYSSLLFYRKEYRLRFHCSKERKSRHKSPLDMPPKPQHFTPRHNRPSRFPKQPRSLDTNPSPTPTAMPSMVVFVLFPFEVVERLLFA